MLEGRNGAVSHLSMCSWEEEMLPVAPSGEPAYGMKIRLNFTACVSVYSSGVCVGGSLKVLALFQDQFHFVFYYENSSCETLCVFWVIWLDLFHCTWQFTLGFSGRVAVFFVPCVCWSRCSISCLLEKKNVCGL